MEVFWNVGVEKPLSIQILVSFYGSLEYETVESNADDKGLACEVSEGSVKTL